MTARDFINRCLVIDQTKRMTAVEALNHPWLSSLGSSHPAANTSSYNPPDLLPSLRKNFDARGTFRRAIFAVRAAAALKDGGEQRRATLNVAALGGTTEEQKRVREEAERAKRDAEEEAVISPSLEFPRSTLADGSFCLGRTMSIKSTRNTNRPRECERASFVANHS